METALAAAKLGAVEQLASALDAKADALNARDAEGRQLVPCSLSFFWSDYRPCGALRGCVRFFSSIIRCWSAERATHTALAAPAL